MVDVANGVHPAGIKIIDEEKTCATILPSGRLDKNLYGFGINSRFTIELIKIERIKKDSEKYNL